MTVEHTHHGEIWQKSQCIAQEENTVSAIYQQLSQLDYNKIQEVSHTRSVWQKGHAQVVVSLVDDCWDCAQDRSQATPYMFDHNTTVITDNFITTPTVWKQCLLPESFYGIYSYTPGAADWCPERDFTFAVNRIDFKRVRVLSQLHQTLGLAQGFVNFNCALGRDHAPAQLQQNFRDQFIHANAPELPDLNLLAEQMPMRNYTIDHDTTYHSSWVNIVVETYSSDTVISLSEKIFRCLVTPAPWIVYAGRYTVARLAALGFDVLDDVVDHNYDQLLEAQHKVPNVVQAAERTIRNLKQMPWPRLKHRCQAAAAHNQSRLALLKQTWQQEQPHWIAQLQQRLS